MFTHFADNLEKGRDSGQYISFFFVNNTFFHFHVSNIIAVNVTKPAMNMCNADPMPVDFALLSNLFLVFEDTMDLHNLLSCFPA